MKNKPLRHKDTNTFQFKKFSERINEIDVDVFHRVTHRNEDAEEDAETYFHQTLQKWNFLNLTEGYTSFKKLVHHIVTLPQLINEKEFVIDTLLEYVKKKDVLFLQPILELVVAVAKDLQKEFYGYFPRFLSVIIDLLHTKDTEQIEYAFTCLAYLFKFLWRYLVKNIRVVFKLLLPLLADSQPTYINNFAAESFAFVVRKVKDKHDFLKAIINTLEDQENGVSGCGKLLFEVISGTPGQFHSCAEQMLTLYVNAIKDESINQELTFNILNHIISCVTQHISPQSTTVFWTVMLNVIDSSIELDKISSESSKREANLVLIMKLLHTVISHKNGKLLIEPVPLLKKLMTVMDIFMNQKIIIQEAVNVAITILLANHVKLMQETSSQVLLKIMSIEDENLLYNSTESLINCTSFETLILPQLLQHCASVGFSKNILELFTKIIKAKAPPSCNGINLEKWRKYNLNISSVKAESIAYLLEELKHLPNCMESTTALKVLIILPHLQPLPPQLKAGLKDIIPSIYREIMKPEIEADEAKTDKLCFSLLLALEAAIHIFDSQELHDYIKSNEINIVDLIEKHPKRKIILNAVDLIMTQFSNCAFRNEYINQIMFDSINNTIKHELGSPFSEVRLIVTHLYSLFANIEEITGSSATSEKSALELLYLAECEPVSVQSYRNKVLYLQCLTFENNSIINLNSTYYDVPLRYLLGNFYINFSLLWEPVTKIVATYATKECGQFWPVFLSAIESTEPNDNYKPLFECKIISDLECSMRKSNDIPHYDNFKILLWKCMASFPQYCETKNRDLTGIFIDFVNEHFFKSNSEDAKTYSILDKTETSQKNQTCEDMIVDESDDDENEEKDNTVCEKEDDKDKNIEEKKLDHVTEKEELIVSDKQQQVVSFKRHYKLKLLLAQLEIFGKMMNPRTLYREPEVQKIYLDLLMSKSVDVQKAALNCLLTYKYNYLLPYKENLYSLINEKNLKNELARFKIDEESRTVQEEHRKNFIPILMRIIYAKMVTKTGMRTGGKAGGHVRRKMILRFLAGLQEEEMMIFVKMAFKPFKKYMQFESNEEMNLEEKTRKIVDTTDLTNVIPPKRLLSSVNLLGIIIEQFGSKMATKLLPSLLGLVICILAEIVGILERSKQVYPRYLTSLKNIRTNCINILARFFEHFENYPWTASEINALCNVAVYPWLKKLHIEGIHSPTPLLKLFIVWSQNSRYYPLFIKYGENDKSLSPLPYIIRLLLGPKTHPSVINAILSMIEKIVTLQDYGKTPDSENAMEVDIPNLDLVPICTNLLEIREDVLATGVNYGSVILLPHVLDILEHLKNKLKTSIKGMSKTELVILSRISEFVTDGEACDVLLSLTLPILVRKATAGESEESIIELITTAINLVKHVEKPERHIRGTAPLLGIISSTPARKLAIQLYGIIAEKSTEAGSNLLKQNVDLLRALNAWDSRWIDQPDFQKRLDAFGEISNMAEKDELTLEFGVAIIYNCFYFLKSESDLAMKDFAGQCLKSICPKLAKKFQDHAESRSYFMDDTILPILKKGIVHKVEVVRLQSIGLLGHMAMECPEVHLVLRDLALLTNKADPEVDFFENMQHLQLHRRSRALLKFCTIAKTLKKAFNPRTLTQFILPLATSYICNETFASKNNLVDAAIETIGTVCNLLPWHHYEIILKYYLNKLRTTVEFQKQLVRIIVAILDAFHFDMSKYKQEGVSTALKSISQESEFHVSSTEENKDNDGAIQKEESIDADQDSEEKLEEALNEKSEEIPEEITEKPEEKTHEEIPAIQKEILLSQSGARRIVVGISKGLLPQLHRAISARTRHENSHKVNKKREVFENEDEELMRVPIALALVKLLQKLPESVLDANLPGIFMKLCTFLKSRLDSIRRETREILQKIMITLGPKYLHHLLREMNTLLTRGFQVHVLAYTVQSVLVALKPYFQRFDINDNLQTILSVCKVDLFGPTGEEKEVIGIVKNVSEARATKSYDIFHILAQYITESCLLDLILPLKEVLARTHSHKTVQKVVECLRHVILGLADNTFIPLEQMLIFTYGVISESIPELLPKQTYEHPTTRELTTQTRKKQDCYIIPPEPKTNMGIKAVARTSKNMNVHVITEFGLKFCHVLLRRDKISNPEFRSFIDPFVPVLCDCIKSQHVKLSTLSVQCLTWLLRMNLPSIQDLTSDICTSIFSILHKYAAAGLSKGDNFDLVVAAFKCVSVIVRDVKHFTISSDQLKLLIMYAEQDLNDSEKQATAFRLLKAIIARKMVVPEMYPVMEKVASLSITSELEHVRQQSRSVFYSYLMEYPLGKHLDKHISFYLTQLNYELQPGRLSALEMLHSIVTGFPLKALISRSELILLMAGVRLINDDDPTCRKLCAKCLKEMITRMPYNKKSKLFDLVIEWLKDIKVAHRTLAAQLAGIFVTVEKDKFESRLGEILPLLLKQFYANYGDEDAPGRFVRLESDESKMTKEIGSNIKDPERLKDHHMFQVLQLLLKICAHCSGFLKNSNYTDSVRSFAEYSQSLLAHPHLWVRLAATQMIGFVLATLDIDKVTSILENSETAENLESENGYIYVDTASTLKSLSLDLIAQLQPDMTFEELADQVVKNLIFIARILKSVGVPKVEDDSTKADVNGNQGNQLSLIWLVRRLRKVVNIEIVRSPKSTTVRTAAFKWIAGAVATIPIEDLKPTLFNIMSPLVREMSTTDEINAPLRRLAKEAATMIKKSLGSEEYMRLLNKIQQKLEITKTARRKIRTQQFVTNPELAAKRKIARQQKKKEAKKRKMESMKGKKGARKRPRKEVDLDII